ncbi:MAG: hypothetical protein HEP71_30740 [Roseivirga sp.]|nr:hypothetical protein [Roseivirga sp.]
MKFKFVLLTLLSLSLSVNAQSAKKKKQVEDIANKIAASIEENNEEFLTDIFDLKAFSERILINGPSPDLQRFNKGFLTGISKRPLLSTLLLEKVVASGADYEFLRVYFDKKDPHIVFRLFGEDGINYHDFLLQKVKGKYKIIDMYFYLSGEYLSATYQRLYIMTGKQHFDASQTAGMSDLTLEDLTKVSTARGLVQQGEYEAARDLIEGMNEGVRNEKLFKILELQIKSNLSDEGYLEAIEDYKRVFPDDPSVDLVSLDLLLLNEKFIEAHEAIDNLNKRVGGDTFLDFYHASIYYAQSDFKKAEKLFLRFISNHPNNED